MRARDLISKCMEGGAPHDIIQSIEEELPDTRSIRLHIIKDLKSRRIRVEANCVKADESTICIQLSESVHASRKGELLNLVDVYSRTYPEVDVVINVLP